MLRESPRRAADPSPIGAPAGVRKSTLFLPEVESLRGIAILLVVLHHADGMLTPHLDGGGLLVSPLRAFLAAGQSGVSLFFVLSAFCLAAPIFRDHARGAGFSIGRFYARRALRILPLYWSVLLVAALAATTNGAGATTALPWAFFLQAYPGWATPIEPFTNVTWSLATEVQFYGLLPLLPLALSSRTRAWGLAAAILVYAAVYLRFLHDGSPATTVNGAFAIGHSILGRGPIFLSGIAVAWLHVNRGDAIAGFLRRSAALRSGACDLALFLVLVALGHLLQWQVMVGYWSAEAVPTAAWHVAEGLLWSAVLLILLVAPLRAKGLFCNHAFGVLGVLSYSIYLLHAPVLIYSLAWAQQWSPRTFDSWNPVSMAGVAAATAICIALSSQTYRWIEKPFLVRKANLGA